MYIHNYYKNPAFYDIYDYDWDNNDPGPLPDGDHRSYIFPVGKWSTDPKSLAPLGADRSPPWHQHCVPLRRYNNRVSGNNLILGWEDVPHVDPGVFGDPEFEKGTDKINSYNAGQSTNAIPIWDGPERSYLMACGHCLNGGSKLNSGPGYDHWIFMNEAGTTYKVTAKPLHDTTRIDPSTGEPLGVFFADEECGDCPPGFGCWEEADENQGRCYHRGFDQCNDLFFEDTALVEIDTIEEVTVDSTGREITGTGNFEDTMTDIGCPPISKTIDWNLPFNNDANTKNIPVMLGPDRQGRALLGMNVECPRLADLKNGLSIGRNGSSPMVFPEYNAVHSGDSGTATWVNTKSGWVYMSLYAADGIINENMINHIRENITPDYNIELVNLSDGSEYEVLDYFEHPDIEYSQSKTGGDDGDSNTVVPVIPDLSFKVRSEYTDENGNDIDYTAESNEIETRNSTLIVDPSTSDFAGFFTLNGNEFDFGSDVNWYTDSVDICKIDVKFINRTSTNREDFKMISFEEDFGDSWDIKIDGISVNDLASGGAIRRVGKTGFYNAVESTFGSDPTERKFAVKILYQILFAHENLEFFNIGTEYPLTILYRNSRTNDEINLELGNIIFPRTPENIRLEYDESELYPGNQLTINLVTDNVPVPDLTFRLSSIVNATPDLLNIDSVTDNTITATVTGDVGELIALSIPVFWGYDESANRINGYGSPLTFVSLIGEPPAITAQLEINPDVNNDGFANTYEDSLNIVITNDADLDNHNWTITPKPIIE